MSNLREKTERRARKTKFAQIRGGWRRDIAKTGLRLFPPIDHLPHFVLPIPPIGNPKLPRLKSVRRNFPIAKVLFSLLTLAPFSAGLLPGAKRGQGGRRRNGVFARSHLSHPNFHSCHIFARRHLGTWGKAGIFKLSTKNWPMGESGDGEKKTSLKRGIAAAEIKRIPYQREKLV